MTDPTNPIQETALLQTGATGFSNLSDFSVNRSAAFAPLRAPQL